LHSVAPLVVRGSSGVSSETAEPSAGVSILLHASPLFSGRLPAGTQGSRSHGSSASAHRGGGDGNARGRCARGRNTRRPPRAAGSPFRPSGTLPPHGADTAGIRTPARTHGRTAGNATPTAPAPSAPLAPLSRLAAVPLQSTPARQCRRGWLSRRPA